MVKEHKFRAGFILSIECISHHRSSIARTKERRQGKSIEHVPDDVMTAIERYDWAGNIRELQNFIERSVILTKGSSLQAPSRNSGTMKCTPTSVRTLADADRAHIIGTLQKTNWVVGRKEWCRFQTRPKPDNSHRQNAETRDLSRNPRATCSAIELVRQRTAQGSIGVRVRPHHLGPLIPKPISWILQRRGCGFVAPL